MGFMPCTHTEMKHYSNLNIKLFQFNNATGKGRWAMRESVEDMSVRGMAITIVIAAFTAFAVAAAARHIAKGV